jgi:FlaA1/EpsC-like NDP-sugar epimerase
MTTIIIGKRSNLSKELKKNIVDSKIVSSNDFSKLKLKSNSNLIINSFFPSLDISNIDNYSKFINLSLSNLTKALDVIDISKIKKVIYTSSSSVYGLDVDLITYDKRNRNLYAKGKLLAETIIINFCKKNNISYIIARLFNVYGDNDKFSIIAKLINCYKNKNYFYLYNLGSAIRDFINYKQISHIYNKMLKSKSNGIFDIGCGKGFQIKDLINFLGNKNFNFIKKRVDEISISIAKKNIFNESLDSEYLIKYLKKKLKIKKKSNFKKHTIQKNQTFDNFINKTIIYGAGNAGMQLNKILNKKSPNSVYCFIDDNKKIQNEIIDNKKVISFDEFKKIAIDKTISKVIISIPSLTPENLKRKIKILKSLAVNIDYLPLKENLLSDKITIDDIKYSKLTNLLDDDFSRTNNSLLKKLKNKSVLVTGSAGSIGMALCKKLNQIGTQKIIALDKSEIGIYNMKKEFSHKRFEFILGDINNSELLHYIEDRHKIDLVFHAAAYKHLNILEDNACEAVKNNIFGTLNIIKNFSNHNVIIISTDKATNPTSILGLTKRISEIISLSYKKTNSKVNVVRFGNVFASQGSAINLFLDQINKGGPITITNKKVKRFFMSSSQAANLVLKGSQLSSNKNILILDMGKQVKLSSIIEKLLEINKDKNPYSQIKIKEIGLQKGEKLKEKLYIGKTKKIKKEKRIFIANEPKYSSIKIDNMIGNLSHYLDTYNAKKLTKEMKIFLFKEIKI